MLKMHKYPSKVFTVLVNTVISLFYVRTLQETQDGLL